MEELKYLDNYQDYRAEVQTELQKASEGFVRIGYLLKLARDTSILSGSQYKDYLEFAQGEFGLDKSTVSRFVRINDRFSEGGCTDQLLEQYKGFGYSKLALMLTIPESVAEELTPDYTKSEIQEIKQVIEEEQSKTEIEHLEENMAEIMNPPTDSMVIQTIRQLGEEMPDLYVRIWKGFGESDSCEGIKDIFKPLPQMTYVVRVPGKGKVVLMAKEEGASITIARTEEKIQASWMEIYSAWSEVVEICTEDGDALANGEQSWQQAYGKEFPKAEKEKVAPVQPKRVEVPKKAEKKPEPVKAPYVKEMEKIREELKEEPEEAIREVKEEVSEPEEVSGEVIEESGLLKNEESEEPKEAEEPENTQPKLESNTIRGYKAGLSADIRTLERMLRDNQYKAIKTKLETMLNTVNRIIDETEEVEG